MKNLTPAETAQLDQLTAHYSRRLDFWIAETRQQADRYDIDQAIANVALAMSMMKMDQNEITALFLVALRRLSQQEQNPGQP